RAPVWGRLAQPAREVLRANPRSLCPLWPSSLAQLAEASLSRLSGQDGPSPRNGQSTAGTPPPPPSPPRWPEEAGGGLRAVGRAAQTAARPRGRPNPRPAPRADHAPFSGHLGPQGPLAAGAGSDAFPGEGQRAGE